VDKGDDSDTELMTTPVACVADSLISKGSESALLLCFTTGELINLSSPELLGIFWETEETGGNSQNGVPMGLKRRHRLRRMKFLTIRIFNISLKILTSYLLITLLKIVLKTPGPPCY